MNQKVVMLLFVTLSSGAVAVGQTPERAPQRLQTLPPEYLPGQAPGQAPKPSLYDLLKQRNIPYAPNSSGGDVRAAAPVQAGQAVGAWWTVPSIVSRMGLCDEHRKKLRRSSISTATLSLIAGPILKRKRLFSNHYWQPSPRTRQKCWLKSITSFKPVANWKKRYPE